MNPLTSWLGRRRRRAALRNHVRWTKRAIELIETRDPELARTLWLRVNGILVEGQRLDRDIPDVLQEVTDLVLDGLQQAQSVEEVVSA